MATVSCTAHKMEWNGVLGHDSTLQSHIGPETTWANEVNVNVVIYHAPGAGLVARPVDQQSSELQLCYDAHVHYYT